MMDSRAIVKNLNQNVDVIERTFSANNIQLINYGFCGVSENGWLELLVEIATIKGHSIPDDLIIKVNLYDEDDTIIYSYDDTLCSDDFSGYDTLHFYLNEDNLAFNAKKSRLFMTKS